MSLRIGRQAGSFLFCLVFAGFSIQVASAEDKAPNSSPISQEAELAAKAIQIPAGFTLKTVASEPNLANPVAFCFDPNGRIFVAETYRVGKGIEDDRSHMNWLDDDLATQTVADRIAYLKKHLGEKVHKFEEVSEKVRLLEDRDGDGIYESSSVFSDNYKNIEDGTAAGVLWSKDRLLFTCIPSLWELRDADGDGKAEQRRALATGFGVRTSFYGHDLHGLCEGPDGKVYFSIGDRGMNVQTPDGAIVNPGCGAVLRCNPDGSKLELFATGLRNPQELAFNEFGDLFTVDNNSDAGDKAKLYYIVEGMDAGWRMPFQYLADRGPFNREKIWYPQNADQPASIVPPVENIADGPSGLVHYPGTGLPAAYDGAFFLVDFRGAPATSGIREFHVDPQGSTYHLANYKSFVTGVLATDCDFGPDGAFYILDWVEGWSGAGKGRIQRVASDDANAGKQRTEFQSSMKKVRSASVDDLIALLSNPNMRVRLAAQQRLVDMPADSVAPLKELAANQDAALFGRLHAIWALGELAETAPANFDDVAQLCFDKNAEVRAQAARTLGRASHAEEQKRTEYGDKLLTLLSDASPRVRFFATVSLGKLRQKDSLDALVQLAGKDGDDPTLRHAIAMALASSQPAEVLAKAADGKNDLQRLVLTVALGKLKSPLVAQFLNDKNDHVALEAARTIWDTPIPAAYPALVAMIEKVPSASDPLLRRVLAANVAGRTAENLQAVIRLASRSDLSVALRDLAWEQIRNWATPSPRDSVDGDWRPLEPRPVAEVAATVRAALPTLIKASSSNPIGIIVAAELGVEEAYGQLTKVVTDDAQPAAVRVRALAAFEKASDALTHQAIDAGIKSPDAAVRSAARKLWADRFPDQVIDRLSDTINTGATQEKQAAIDTLAGLPNAEARKVISDWMDRLENGKCPPELQVELLDAAGKSSDPKLVEREKRFAAKLAADGRVAQYTACLTGGDAERGKKLFETNDVFACRRCHSVKAGEILVGPCLANVGGQRKPNEILESIVSPNAKICEGFETAVLQLDSGKIITGIIRKETDSKIELVDADAKTVVIDPSTVEGRVKGKSPMPENLMEQMSPRQLRDLIAFLSQLKTADAAPKAKSK